MPATKSAIKYLQFPITVDPGTGGLSPAEAEGVVSGYLEQGYTLVSTTVSDITKSGFFVVHVLVK